MFLLLFVYVFGGTLGAGLPGRRGGGDARRLPGLHHAGDPDRGRRQRGPRHGDLDRDRHDQGIIARFRTMDIARVSVLTGHVLGAVIKTAGAVVVVTAFAFLIGFRSPAGPLDWLGVVGLLVLIAFSLTWLTVGMGLAADSVETASNTAMFLVMLPFVSSGFVPTGAMPVGLRQFAEYQPFTPMINTLRALVTGAPTGTDLWLAVGWCLVVAAVGFLWSRRLFLRVPSA